MKTTQIRHNLDGLEALKKGMGDDYRARVGVLGTHAARDDDAGINNAELLLIQMFGSITNNIPPRDPLIMPIERNRREIVRALESGMVRAAFEAKDYKKIYEILGVKALEYVHMAFETGGFGSWPPNAPATIAAKGSAAPLIDTRQLDRAMTTDVVKASEAKGSVAQINIGG